jgi:hypothetical protein
MRFGFSMVSATATFPALPLETANLLAETRRPARMRLRATASSTWFCST